MEQQPWQDEWPTEPGMWWFYGWCYRKIAGGPDEPAMHLVNVRKAGSGGFIYIEKSRFLYKEEGAEGKWLKAILPAAPEGIKAR